MPMDDAAFRQQAARQQEVVRIERTYRNRRHTALYAVLRQGMSYRVVELAPEGGLLAQELVRYDVDGSPGSFADTLALAIEAARSYAEN